MTREGSLQAAAGSEVRLEPATVTGSMDSWLLVRRPDGEAWARVALALPYDPAPGDVVLTIGSCEVYVIGVLKGAGRTRLRVEGDLEIHASGRLDLGSGREIGLRSPAVEIRADRVEIVARALFQKLLNSYRWVRDVIQTHAGRTRTLVEGHHMVSAERILGHARKDVKLDGRKILLG